jgi:hypothetical protein
MQYFGGLVSETVSLDDSMPTEHTDDQPALCLVGLGLKFDLAAFECRVLLLALGNSSFENRQERL